MGVFRTGRRPRFRFGPGLVVTAAFIGPGTITTASIAGARFGFSLLWSIVFAVVATIVLQEMAARLGLISGLGPGEALRSTFDRPWMTAASIALVVIAIGVLSALLGPKNPKQIRLGASRAILDHVLRLREHGELSERLAALEDRLGTGTGAGAGRD